MRLPHAIPRENRCLTVPIRVNDGCSEPDGSCAVCQGQSHGFGGSLVDTPWSDERALRRSYWTPVLKLLGIRHRRPYNMRHTYATAMLMAGMNHSFCAKQLGHSVDQFQRTYTKWIDGEQNDREMDRLEMAIKNLIRPKLGPEIAKNLVSTCF